jgi:hypothetical protein
MYKDKFNIVFPIIVAALVDKIAVENNISEDKSIESLYTSQLYSALEDEETKVWQYSTEKLYDLYKEEKETGQLDLPKY